MELFTCMVLSALGLVFLLALLSFLAQVRRSPGVPLDSSDDFVQTIIRINNNIGAD